MYEPFTHAVINMTAKHPADTVVQLCTSERQAWTAVACLDRFYNGELTVHLAADLDQLETSYE